MRHLAFIFILLMIFSSEAYSFWGFGKKEAPEAKAKKEVTEVSKKASKETKATPEARDPELRTKAVLALRAEMEQKNLKRAYQMATDLIHRDPMEPYAYYVAGLIELTRGQYKKGDENLITALSLRLEPDDVSHAYYNLAVSAGKRGQLNRAKNFLEEALVYNSDDKVAKELLEKLEARPTESTESTPI